MINESGNKVVGLLKRLIVEVSNSQSSKLATGYISFDKGRFITNLNLIIKEIESSELADFPESHPQETKDITIKEGGGE